MKLSLNENMTLRELVRVEIYKSKTRKVEMYADADDNFSHDLYWVNKINELERILDKLRK
tara:strand:+ start:354 stop:533 length:180 start_codon:yes stop_codon:yes gene_type:complete